jgi:hypothetical protein
MKKILMLMAMAALLCWLPGQAAADTMTLDLNHFNISGYK